MTVLDCLGRVDEVRRSAISKSILSNASKVGVNYLEFDDIIIVMD